MGKIEDFVREVHRDTGYTGKELMETAYFTLMLMGDFAGNKEAADYLEKRMMEYAK